MASSCDAVEGLLPSREWQGLEKSMSSFILLEQKPAKGIVGVTSNLESVLGSIQNGIYKWGIYKLLGNFSCIHAGRSWQIGVSQSRRIAMIKGLWIHNFAE